jgi:nucleotide-binding universal stress UspA family protein
MFRRILVPTDGSEVSMRAVQEGVAFAQAMNATVVGFYSPEDYQVFLANEYLPPGLMPKRAYQAKSKEAVDMNLASIESVAAAAGVPYEGFTLSAVTPWPAIVEAAKEMSCDLIFMASHARKGITGLLKGSQAAQVMTHSSVPVLVWREEAAHS